MGMGSGRSPCHRAKGQHTDGWLWEGKDGAAQMMMTLIYLGDALSGTNEDRDAICMAEDS